MGNRILAACTGVAALVLSCVSPALAAGASASSSTLPPGLQAALNTTLAKDAGPAYAIGKDGCATLARQRLTACFAKGGARFHGKDAPEVSLHLAGYGRGETLKRVKPVAPVIAGNRASYAHGDVTEWWRVLPVGFEQGFTVARRPAGAGELTLALAASRRAASHGKDLGWGELAYGKLVVTDAEGRVVPASLKEEGTRILISVNDAGAAYPLTVDPLVWIEQEIGDPQGSSGYGDAAVLLGSTALIGAWYTSVDYNYQGEVLVYTESNGTWTLTQTLTASDGEARQCFGGSLAVAGTTALIGAPSCGGRPIQGAAYVFTYANGSWTQTQKITASDGDSGDAFGSSVAISGTTALIGAWGATVNGNLRQGAAYVFTESDGSWTQSQKLTASDGAADDQFGVSVSLSGTSALVGAYLATVDGNAEQGAAYVFDDSGGSWSQTQKLTASDGAKYDYFGLATALSGATALIGAPYAGPGHVYVFDEAGGSWSQTQILIPEARPREYPGAFGSDISLDHGSVLIGAPDTCRDQLDCWVGSAYLFKDSDGTWTQSHEFYASDWAAEDRFGETLGWSRNSATALIIAPVKSYGGCYCGVSYFDGLTDLTLAVGAPASVGESDSYVTQAVATNAASAASPAVAVTVAVPAAATFVSASASQGSCSNAAGTVTCSFGQIAGNGGSATANVTLKATGSVGTNIENTARIVKATPALTASAPTAIAACSEGYSEHDGNLGAGARAIEPDGQPYQAPAGEEDGVLTAPGGFSLYVAYRPAGGSWHVIPAPGNALHQYGPAATYAWIVKAGSAGGAFTFCLKHP